MKTITVGGETYYTNAIARAWRGVKRRAWTIFYEARQRLWNAYARAKGMETCEVCDDTRGGAIGNGNIIDGTLLCDYCTSDHMATPFFWRKHPE